MTLDAALVIGAILGIILIAGIAYLWHQARP